MSHYFINDESLPENRKEISFRFLGVIYTFETMAGVFSRTDLDFGTRVLLETVIENGKDGERVLDLGTGFGPAGILYKMAFPNASVDMTDINERAVKLAGDNCARYHLDNQVFVSDGFANIHEMYDVILLNPPIRAGKSVIYRLYEEAVQHLRPEGSLWVVIRKDQGAESTVKKLKSFLPQVTVRKKERGYWVLQSCLEKKD